MSREADFITEMRQDTRIFWDLYHRMVSRKAEWNANSYGNIANLPDGSGNNAGYTNAEVGAVLFATFDEIKLRIFDTAFAGNLGKLL